MNINPLDVNYSEVLLNWKLTIIKDNLTTFKRIFKNIVMDWGYNEEK